MAARQYIVICAQAVGGSDRPFEIVYGWDGYRYSTRNEAIRHGFEVRDSDDFNIGVLRDEKLIEFSWMKNPMHDSDRAELPNIAKQLCLRAAQEQGGE